MRKKGKQLLKRGAGFDEEHALNELAQGRKCERWFMEDTLSMAKPYHWSDVIRSLHDAIHSYQRGEKSDKDARLLLARHTASFFLTLPQK